jgi:hypothetical protein
MPHFGQLSDGNWNLPPCDVEDRAAVGAVPVNALNDARSTLDLPDIFGRREACKDHILPDHDVVKSTTRALHERPGTGGDLVRVRPSFG